MLVSRRDGTSCREKGAKGGHVRLTSYMDNETMSEAVPVKGRQRSVTQG